MMWRKMQNRPSENFCMLIFTYIAEYWLLSSQNMESNILKFCNHIVQTWLLQIDSSDPSSSNDYDSSDDSHYRHKRRKDKKHRKKDPIRLCTTLTEKLLTTAYKSKIIRFKMDEDPLQCRIHFLTFIDSLDMIFSQ